MRTDELDYALPQELIAQHALEPRDASRLLVVRGRGDGFSLADHGFGDLPALLRPGGDHASVVAHEHVARAQ